MGQVYTRQELLAAVPQSPWNGPGSSCTSSRVSWFMEGQTASCSDMIIGQWLLGRLVTGRPGDIPFTVATGNEATSHTCSGQSCLLCRSFALPHSCSTPAQGTSHKQPCRQQWDHGRGQQPGILCPGLTWPWPRLSVPPADTGSQGRTLHVLLLLRGEIQPYLGY